MQLLTQTQSALFTLLKRRRCRGRPAFVQQATKFKYKRLADRSLLIGLGLRNVIVALLTGRSMTFGLKEDPSFHIAQNMLEPSFEEREK